MALTPRILSLILSFSACIFAGTPAFGFAFLSEFLNSGGTTIRQGSVQASDVITDPEWQEDIDIEFCTGGDVYSDYKSSLLEFDSSADAEILADIRDAFNAWSSAVGAGVTINDATINSGCGPDYEASSSLIPSGYSVGELGEAYGGTSGGSSNRNQVFFNNVFDSLDSGKLSPIPSGVVAFTVLSLTAVNGEMKIVDADIILNSEIRFVTSEKNLSSENNRFSLRGVVTHEAGHFLGLAHSPLSDDKSSDDPTTTAATMFPAVSTFQQTESLYALTHDDILGVRNLYPTSGSFTGSNYGGTISGKVYGMDGSGLRGVVIVAFALENKGVTVTQNASAATTFTSMSGAAADPTGSFTLRGLPLNTEMILFAQSADREDVHPNYKFSVFNTPVYAALVNEGGGPKTVAVEAYPDRKIVDIPLERTISDSPGISSAGVFELTPSNPTQGNVNFYVSKYFNPPNDPADTSDLSGFEDFSFTVTSTTDSGSGTLSVSNSNPLQLQFSYGEDMDRYFDSSTSVSVSARRESDDTVFNWNSFLPSGVIKTTQTTMTLAVPGSNLENGTYTISASISDGSLVSDQFASRTISVSNWTSGSALIEYADGTIGGNSGGGGGGCAASESSEKLPLLAIGLLIVAAFLSRRVVISSK